MTREEAYNRIDAIIAKHEIDDEYVTITSFLDYDALRMARKALEQEPKTGHWIAVENEEMETIGYYCSECDLPMETEKRTDFCPNCGAKMVEPQESEE